VLTERQTKTSKLVIARAMSSDSGNYTCMPSNSGNLGWMLSAWWWSLANCVRKTLNAHTDCSLNRNGNKKYKVCFSLVALIWSREKKGKLKYWTKLIYDSCFF
jgi:hypothetical protein